MILESKLKIPEEEADIIDKPELERLFEGSAPPCTVVKAMSGFGKTAVCARAAGRHRENVRWYTLDMTDNKEECFLAYMEELWKSVDGKEADSEEAVQLRVLGLAYRVQQWGGKKNIHIVLDNLGAISSERVQQILSLLLQYAKAHVSFVLITNKELPGFVLPILAGGRGRLVSARELQLTPEEVCRYFSDGRDLTGKVLKQVTEDLCGWPAGIQCVAEYLRLTGHCGSLNWNKILQESLLSCYLEDILETNCPKQAQLLLKQAAVFGEFSWEMCQEVFSEWLTRQDFEEMLSGLAFFCKVPGREDTWRCSKAFRVYLCRLLTGREKRELYRRAALWYQESCRMEEYLNAADSFSGRLSYLRASDEKRRKAFMGKKEGVQEDVLEIRSFGTFRVAALRDGKELAWRTRKGRELFAYLLDLRGRAVERRQLIEALWQDEIPANAVAMLHNMIYNIRKELSAYSLETILSYENKRYRLSMDGISCDVWHIQRMTALVEKKDIVNLKKEYKSFLKYWGSYLGDIDSIWAEDRRAYYDEIYKKGCWLLAGQFDREDNYETALALYENILSLEPYSEHVVEKMLVLYGRQRKWEKLRKCYQDFTEILEKDLGIEPGEEVLAAYHHYLQ